MSDTPPKCETPDFCIQPENFYSQCLACETQLEEAINQNLANMGTPDWYGCYQCGGWFPSGNEYLGHFPCLVVENVNS